MMFREGQAPRPTKSDGDSVYAKQTERFLKCKGGGAGQRDSTVLERVMRGEGLLCNPSVLTAKSLQHKNGWHIASRKQ